MIDRNEYLDELTARIRRKLDPGLKALEREATAFLWFASRGMYLGIGLTVGIAFGLLLLGFEGGSA